MGRPKGSKNKPRGPAKPPPAPVAEDNLSLAAMEKTARALMAESIEALRTQAGHIQNILDGALQKGHIDSKMIRDMTVAQGIILDKTPIIIRALRDLQSATDEELEAWFEIWEIDENGKKRKVS